MRRRSGGTGFVLAYFILEITYAFVDIVRGCFQLLGMSFRGIQWFIDQSRKTHPNLPLSSHSAFDMRLAALVEPYMPTLVGKRQKLLTTDDYGIIRDERWSKELGYFIGKVLVPRLGSDLPFVRRNLRYVAQLLDDMIAERQNALTDEEKPLAASNAAGFGRRQLQN